MGHGQAATSTSSSSRPFSPVIFPAEYILLLVWGLGTFPFWGLGTFLFWALGTFPFFVQDSPIVGTVRREAYRHEKDSQCSVRGSKLQTLRFMRV